ncbi:hypothetical protein CH063_06549 [Colletotrichum higginsianum]|uniref:Uncharacterized protein n=1 Tax=Colletotrichum higginsianum (strain IMI 349063) TaxID=759273 RepID=H1V2Y1_COLHI|nr:hypothetical protein CH063_06549 [Colletotrichum higginsianum]
MDMGWVQAGRHPHHFTDTRRTLYTHAHASTQAYTHTTHTLGEGYGTQTEVGGIPGKVRDSIEPPNSTGMVIRHKRWLGGTCHAIDSSMRQRSGSCRSYTAGSGKETNFLLCPKVALSGRLQVTEMRLASSLWSRVSGRGQQRSDGHRPPSYPPPAVSFIFYSILFYCI